MFKKKNILIGGIAIIVIGAGIYFTFTLLEALKFHRLTYEIVSVGSWQEEVKRTKYHIVTAELLTKKKQATILAERIIEDIILEDSGLKEIEVFFYHKKGAVCQSEAADAYAKWASGEISVKMRAGEIDFIGQSRWWED